MNNVDIEIEDGIQIITMHYGANPMVPELLTELDDALSYSRSDETIHSIILRGKRMFSGGGDVFGMKKAIHEGTQEGLVELVISHTSKTILSILSHPLPVIAAINNAAAGAGLSLAMACDHRIAASDAKLVMAFGTLALIPDSGASYLFPLRFGRSDTLLRSSIGGSVDLNEAKRTGALDLIVDPSSLHDEAIRFARSYLEADRAAVARTKELLNYQVIEDLKRQFSMEEKFMKEMSLRPAFKNRVERVVETLSKK